MIISASYRTDIAAFYSEWFFRRLAAGYTRVRNPYSGNPLTVNLRRESVSGFVFWTRNFGPVLDRLSTLLEFGRPFVVQYTITNYPRSLEAAVIEPRKAIQHMHRLAAEVHPKCPVWRYDPIVSATVTDSDFHRRNFEWLADQLEGDVDEAVISFAQIYKKTERNMNAAGRKHGFSWTDPPDEDKLRLASELALMAQSRGMRLTVCTQPAYVVPGSEEARCVDARRLSAIAGCVLQIPLKANRPGCACHESRDIGEYDTCPQGCAYCYAVRHRSAALARYRTHSPEVDSLVPLIPSPEPRLPLFDPPRPSRVNR